jgi:hypothetical protein
MFGKKKKRSTMQKSSPGMIALVSAGAGAAGAYVFDPKLGKGRRSKARDRVAGSFRHTSKRLARSGRRMRALAVGKARGAKHAVGRHEHGYVDDITLVQRVESRIFRDPHVPKGRLNVDASAGVVFLRGALQRPEQIRDIESAAAKVPGVVRLDSFLHLEGTPAPNKADALAAGRHPWG